MFDQIRHESRENCEILLLHGQFIGGDETDNLRNALNHIASKEASVLIIDLGDVAYLNSTALGVLIAAHTNFSKRNARIILCNISKSIENIFVITKLTLVFEIQQTLNDAINSLSKS